MEVTKRTCYSVDDFELTFEPIESTIDIKKVGEKYEVRYLVYDSDTMNPRTEFDNLGKMVCSHKRYDLGDKHNYNFDDYNSWEEVASAIKKEEKAVFISPLYLYDHSGITISMSPFSCPWDSGQVGLVYITKDALKKEGVTKKNAIEILKGEVKTYDHYLKDEVYTLVRETFDKDKNQMDVDSVGGYYGTEYALEELHEKEII